MESTAALRAAAAVLLSVLAITLRCVRALLLRSCNGLRIQCRVCVCASTHTHTHTSEVWSWVFSQGVSVRKAPEPKYVFLNKLSKPQQVSALVVPILLDAQPSTERTFRRGHRFPLVVSLCLSLSLSHWHL